MSPEAPPSIPEARVVTPPQFGKPGRQDALFRVAVVLVLLASLALAWWAFRHRLVPVQRQSRELASKVSRLSTTVDGLERKWTPAAAEQIRAQYREAHFTLFADEQALGAWLERIQRQAAPLALDLKVQLGQSAAQTNAPEKLAVIPASVAIEVRPAPGTAESAYQRLLRLGRQLAAEGKRADLAELTAEGGPRSVTHAWLVFNLWAGEDVNGPATNGVPK
ncbi:MAG TPA: hypothetical protein VN829_14450 [Dongiaceae bacterium]|nr:hypothetical protein [Dongiaceae bacterium]